MAELDNDLIQQAKGHVNVLAQLLDDPQCGGSGPSAAWQAAVMGRMQCLSQMVRPKLKHYTFRRVGHCDHVFIALRDNEREALADLNEVIGDQRVYSSLDAALLTASTDPWFLAGVKFADPGVIYSRTVE